MQPYSQDENVPLYDAILIVSFGGPEGMDEVMPFLENVLRGKGVPEERKLEVAEHYKRFGGVSPINAQNRELHSLLRTQLDVEGFSDLPLFLANRNTAPFIDDVMRDCSERGYKRILAFVTSAFSCYSGCRQYRENLADACSKLGEAAPVIDKIRVFFNHPLFIETVTEQVSAAFDSLPEDQRAAARLVFTAHSIPQSMADHSPYEEQLREAGRLVAESLGREEWDLVYQSRSGPPRMPWLEPDICDHIEQVHAEGTRAVVVSPLGFISDHLEVLYDLDHEAKETAKGLGMHFARAATPGNTPRIVEMIAELIRERHLDLPERRTVGRLPAKHDICPPTCCGGGGRPPEAVT